MSRTDPLLTLEEFWDEVVNSLQRDDWTEARATLDPSGMAATEAERRFFIDLQSANSGKLRDRDMTLTRHSLSVSFWVRTTHGPFTDTARKAFEREQHIHDALMNRARPWQAKPVSTARRLNASRELYGITVRYDLECYHRTAY